MQNKKIHDTKYERKLVPFERRFFREPIQTISIVARVKGFISEENARKAILKVREQHPLVGARVRLDKNNDAIYTTEIVPENQLKVLKRSSEEDWHKELLKQYKIRFEIEKGPLVRFVLLHSSEISEILIICHEVICDGTSLAILARDLLLYIGNPDREVTIIPEPPLATQGNFPSEIKLSKLITFAIKKMNDTWQKSKISVDDEDIDNLFRAFWDNYTFNIISLELNEEETLDLIAKCKQHNVTVNSALNIAFLAARYSIRGNFKGGKQNILLPVSLRKRYKEPVGEHFGHYAAGFQFKLAYNPELGFWENVKIFNARVREKLDINEMFKIAVLSGLIDQSLVDARSFSFIGKLVPPQFSRYDKIHSFSNDKKNILNKRAKKQIPKMPGLAITNLGKMNYPTKYGSLELDRFIFIVSASAFVELIISAVTVAGRLSIVINYLEEITDTKTMEQIKSQVIRYLGTT